MPSVSTGTGVCSETVVVETDDFENTVEGWSIGNDKRTGDGGEFLTTFMGDLGNNESTSKTFLDLPKDADSISIRFDVYAFLTSESGDASNDGVMVDIDSAKIDLGRLNETDFGTTDSIVWWRSPIGSALVNLNGEGGNDQVHHVSMMVPKEALAEDGSIKLTIYGALQDVTIGIDNVEITAHYSCTCVPDMMVTSENFESYEVDENGAQVRAAGWMNGKIASDPSIFTKFLGRYASAEEALHEFPVKIFDVPPHASSINLEFDFYEIDAWNGDTVIFYVNGDKIDLGAFHHNVSELSSGGESARDIIWTKTSVTMGKLGFNELVNDQIHHVALEIPQAVLATGQISLEFEAHLDDDYSIASAGFDNIVIDANFDCNNPTPVTVAPDLLVGCNVMETDFAEKCSMGSFGANKVNITSSNETTVTFTMSGHPFSGVTLSGVEVWFPDPEKTNEDDFYDKCWSGAETSDADSIFAQEFVAKCEDGWATVSVTAGEDLAATPRFTQMEDVVEPLCTDRVDRPDFNPLKRCIWQFNIPCGCGGGGARRTLLDNKIVVNDAAPAPTHDCRTKSLVKDVHPAKVDKCLTTPSKDTVQIVSQDKDSVTFSVSQKWKGCGGDGGKLGWVATDYINTHGDLECVKKSDLSCGLAETYTAHCTDGIAVVDLYSFDEQEGLFGQTDAADLFIPLACGASGSETKKCHFRYVLNCEPSLCDQAPVNVGGFKKVEQSRRLGDQQKKQN
jgi:hypothetical protein